ncbi:hypothetical protein GCM10010405_50120 [Streptomyces macrosporus]|uniref:Transposase IS701-like DDE domain-containing protein n=1 Tax=Streptomyces macrosporus TaxID=44032 RepID=A0ABN3KH70_9ACTN
MGRGASPDDLQHLLGRAKWDADRVRDDVRESVLEHLHDEDAVLVVDKTGDVEKGTHTVGVQRRSPPSASRREVPPPAPPAGSRTPRSPSTSSTQAAMGMRRWIVSCTSPARGRAFRTAARRRDWARTPPSRPSLSRPPA